MPRRRMVVKFLGLCPPQQRGVAPLINNSLTEGHSHFRTSGGEAKATNAGLLSIPHGDYELSIFKVGDRWRIPDNFYFIGWQESYDEFVFFLISFHISKAKRQAGLSTDSRFIFR